MAKYTEQFKLSVIADIESGTMLSWRAAAQRHNVDEATVRKWVAAYRAHGAAGIERKHEFYSAPFKQFVLEQAKSEGLSDRQAAARFNIRNPSAIGVWRRQYDEGGFAALSARSRARPQKMPKPPQAISPSRPDDDARTREELLEELQHLRMENAYLKKLEALAQAQQHAAQRKKRKSCSS